MGTFRSGPSRAHVYHVPFIDVFRWSFRKHPFTMYGSGRLRYHHQQQASAQLRFPRGQLSKLSKHIFPHPGPFIRSYSTPGLPSPRQSSLRQAVFSRRQALQDPCRQIRQASRVEPPSLQSWTREANMTLAGLQAYYWIYLDRFQRGSSFL